ncbi:MAG: bile acid:sodium symporter [Pseudomonas sp.]
MQRLTLERQQVWIYLGAILIGLLFGSLWPALGPWLELLLWPALILLLYCAFVQVPLLHLRLALGDRRFTLALLIGNFVLLPLLVWGMVQWLPADPDLRLGVLLVLLVPCTDWFITFAQLGRGDTARAISATPINLILQLLLLPLYLWLMHDGNGLTGLGLAQTWPALLVIFLPLALAVLSERWMQAQPGRERLRERLAWWPVPLLAVVVLLIAGAQVQAVQANLNLLLMLVPLFSVFLLLAALLAKALSHWFDLPADQGRTLAFSMGTRNSFVVLPLALALPSGWELVAVVIVMQSLVELFGMLFYLWWLPTRLFR